MRPDIVGLAVDKLARLLPRIISGNCLNTAAISIPIEQITQNVHNVLHVRPYHACAVVREANSIMYSNV
jgi:hypothetical protein